MMFRTDYIEYEPLTSDPIGPPDGARWFNASEGKYKQQIGGESKVVPISIETYSWYENESSPYVDYKGTSYTVIGRFAFSGTSANSASKIFIVVEVDVVGSVRIYDSTNALVIAEKTDISNTSWGVIDLGTISNQSSSSAVWEVQVSTDSSNHYIRLSSMKIEF
jgi:hypothetical protein